MRWHLPAAALLRRCVSHVWLMCSRQRLATLPRCLASSGAVWYMNDAGMLLASMPGHDAVGFIQVIYRSCWLQVHLTVSCLRRRNPQCFISCALTPDGTRTYKIAGKHRTAREVKVRLSAVANAVSLRTVPSDEPSCEQYSSQAGCCALLAGVPSQCGHQPRPRWLPHQAG